MRNLFITGTVIASLALGSCDATRQETSTDVDSLGINDIAQQQGDSVVLNPLQDSPAFADAILELNSPAEGAKLPSGEVVFDYNIKNYKLTEKTGDGSCAINCANSDKGQHIHLILNNEPYLAKYETHFAEKLPDGHYLALSFLSRSYHESIKHYEAYDLRQFTVGSAKGKWDLSKPMLFYSRPKGEYVGKDTKKVLLDFFLVNTELSPEGNKVRAVINGKEFLITKWQAYTLEGLPMGESTIHLELIDKHGKVIEGPYNVMDRKITLK